MHSPPSAVEIKSIPLTHVQEGLATFHATLTHWLHFSSAKSPVSLPACVELIFPFSVQQKSHLLREAPQPPSLTYSKCLWHLCHKRGQRCLWSYLPAVSPLGGGGHVWQVPSQLVLHWAKDWFSQSSAGLSCL
jgi:hypothetical protein